MAKYKPKWKWKKGRLHEPDGNFSLSIEQAYELIPVNKGVAHACNGVLKDYEDLEYKSDRIINELQEERELGTSVL
jgi:hypothetical protein